MTLVAGRGPCVVAGAPARRFSVGLTTKAGEAARHHTAPALSPIRPRERFRYLGK